MGITAIALGGLHQAQTEFDQTARRVATASPADTEDVSTDMVSLISARDQFATNIRMLETGGKMERQAIDLLA